MTITNSCDRAGTIANELPLTEQIPVRFRFLPFSFSFSPAIEKVFCVKENNKKCFQVLHRLDHSIHTMRLWTVTKAKELCSDWNMRIFFQVVHDDMEKCLEHLNDLRLPGE